MKINNQLDFFIFFVRKLLLLFDFLFISFLKSLTLLLILLFLIKMAYLLGIV